MIDKARAEQIYDQLSVGDIETALAAPGPAYDLIIAADTLVYLGDLDPVLRGARARLAPDGYFLFTVEAGRGRVSAGPQAALAAWRSLSAPGGGAGRVSGWPDWWPPRRARKPKSAGRRLGGRSCHRLGPDRAAFCRLVRLALEAPENRFKLVAIDSGIHAGARPVLNVGITLSGVIGVAAALLGLGVMAAHGFDE